MTNSKLYRPLLSLLTAALLTSCGPGNTSHNNSNDLSNFKTGGTTTVINPINNKKSVVPYVNSGDKKVFQETVEEIETLTEQQREESNKILSQKIKAVKLNFYNGQTEINDINESSLIRLIITLKGKNKTYHSFITSKDSLTDISGQVAHSLKTNASKKTSPLIADINCKSESCNKSTITLTIPKSSSTSSGDKLDYDIISKIAYAKTKAKVKIEASKGQEELLKESNIYKNINSINDGEEYPLTKVSVVVADGASYTEIQKGDLIDIKVHTTDTRDAPAQINKSDITIKDTQVKDSTLSGVTTGGATIIDITSAPGTHTTTRKDPVDNNQPAHTNSTSESTVSTVKAPTTKPKETTTQGNNNLNTRLTIISEEEDLDFQERELNKNFRLSEVKSLIESGEAHWQDVGVNPNTSLFFMDVNDPEERKIIMLAEADFESYREHPVVQQHIEKNIENVCREYIPNMSPLRKIISDIHIQNNISPNFASLMYSESMYGKNNRYQVQINLNCETSSGPYQITNDTVASILNYNGLAKELKINGYNFITRNSKMYFKNSNNPTDRSRCNVETTEVRQDDHRMFLESSTILGSSYSRYIYLNKHQEDAALVFSAYNQGAVRYTKLADEKNNHQEFAVFKTRLEDIEKYNISTFQHLGSQKEAIKNSVDNGILYSFKTLAIRSILSQPETYCDNLSEADIQGIYSNADQKIKDKSFQNKVHLLHPSGPILDSTRGLIN